ncbi:hypothetical protein AVEN_191897-1 [Araneus ventricosus]|uniref:Uncharacterized protein n=1 Tax=Araneus ventricosus TaxID=182803 RepID=A0A4Y1ZJI6_ARAVE|nr:hypothetical protein AVEN_191897-1 [Araneus ventricosus]
MSYCVEFEYSQSVVGSTIEVSGFSWINLLDWAHYFLWRDEIRGAARVKIHLIRPICVGQISSSKRQEKCVSSFKCSDSISWILNMYLPQTKSAANVRHIYDLRGKC